MLKVHLSLLVISPLDVVWVVLLRCFLWIVRTSFSRLSIRLCHQYQISRGISLQDHEAAKATLNYIFSREGSVYFNIRGEESVIQASLKGGECNLPNWVSTTCVDLALRSSSGRPRPASCNPFLTFKPLNIESLMYFTTQGFINGNAWEILTSSTMNGIRAKHELCG